MRKRIISALLTLVMLLSLIPAMGTTASAAADSTGPVTVGPSDPAVTITIKDVQAGKLAQDVAYEVKYSDGTTGGAPYAPFDGVERKTPWQVKETGRYLLKNYIAYNGNTLADYDDHFYAGMTYKLVIAGNSVQFKGADKIKLVFEDCGIVSTSGAMQKETINDYTCYTLDVTLGGEMQTHGLKVDESIDHAYRRLENGTYEEISLPGDRTLQIPEGTKLKFTVDKDYMSDGGVLKFFKGFQTKIVNRKDREYSSKDKGFIEGNFKMRSRSGQEIVLQMGDRDTSISAVFTDDQLVRLNAIYLDVLPAIENGRQVTVVTPSGEATRVAATPGLSSADKFATYTITGHTAEESNPNDNGVYLYKKSADPNTETDGKYTLEFSVKLNGNFYCSNRTTKLYINGKLVPEKDITQVTGFGDSDSLPVYWSIENRKIEAFGSSGWEIHITMNDFASQYYPAGSGYGLGLDAPMDFKKADDGNYRYTVSDGNTSKEVRAYGSFEAASGQSCTVTFPVAVPDGIRKWNAKHSGEEKIGFSFLEGATGGVFVQDAAGGSYSPVSATYTVSDPDSDGNVTATATFTPENGKLYRVMGSVAATWNGKIVATTPADNSFIYVKGVAKNYLTGSVVYTSAVRYGDDVSIGRTGVLGTIPTDKLHYQWQWKNGEAWTDIYRATNGQLPKERIAESLVGKQIRVMVTADGYEGVIYSEAKTVSKATWNQAPVAPIMTCEANETDTYVPR